MAARLISDVGFDPVDAGPLEIAQYMEPFALLVGQLAYEEKKALNWHTISIGLENRLSIKGNYSLKLNGMSDLEAWNSFFIIVGSSAGALIGLQFVVLTLIAEKSPPRAAEAEPAFATPTIVHFGAVLLLSAVQSAPWQEVTFVAAILCLMGLSGVVYMIIVARQVRVQTAYEPEFGDWLYYSLLPLAAYAMLTLSASRLCRITARHCSALELQHCCCSS